jgi:DNA-binding response OmpR family regulator/anti-sigma regulatory factor (Ser/Thr protein kinase)
MKLFDETRPATPENVSWLRRSVRRELVGLKLQSELINDVQLVVAELATNALVHAGRPPNQIGVHIDLIGASLRIEISDDGSPFTEFQSVWEQAARQDVVASHSSGLGLALSHALLHNVSYTSGTDGAMNRLTGWRPLQRMRPAILIVDDDSTVLRVYAAVLKARYRIFTATSVASAVSLAETETIDLILSDYHLGDELGTTLLSLLERDAERLPVPIIMLSADRNLSTRQSADGYGIEMFLTKPVAPRELRQAVEQVMTRSRKRLASIFRYFGANVERLALRPSESELTRLRIASRSAIASAGGGDFVLHLSTPGRERIVLVDVMGHGLKAKAGAIAFAALLRAIHAMLPLGTGPGMFLTTLSNVMRRDGALSEVIATLVVADRHPDGLLEISCAAHPSPVVIGADGVIVLKASGALVGIEIDAQYPVERLRLSQGERLVLVTDGVEPKFLAGGGHLPPGLVACLTAKYDAPLADAADAAAEWAHAIYGPSPPDDWTIMLVE